MEREAQNPNEILVPVILEDETVWMTPPEYYCWLGKQAIYKGPDELPTDMVS